MTWMTENLNIHISWDYLLYSPYIPNVSIPFFNVTSVLFLIPLLTVSDTMVKHLQSADACRSFSEFRQEASMLHSLQHPCIVSLVGISIHPLCFALQLAPLGSLNTVLEEKHKGKGTYRGSHHVVFLL